MPRFFAQTFCACLVALALTACGPSPAPAETAALGFGEIRWKSLPVPLQVDDALLDNGPKEKALRAAITFWESKVGKTLFQLSSWPHGSLPYSGTAENPDDLLTNALIFQDPWPTAADWGDAHAGKTTLHTRGVFIENAVIFLDPHTPLCLDLCQSTPDATSLRRLLAHELGHFLGLGHSGDTSNIMYEMIQAGGSLDDRDVDLDLLKKLVN